MLNVMVGTAPVNWNNRDIPDHRPETPYAQMLDEMAAAGYAGTEYGSEFPADRERVERDLGARGLKLASTFCALDLRDPASRAAEIARAEELARFLASLGGDIIIVADSGDERRRSLAGRADRTVALGPAEWQSLLAGLGELAERCSRVGVRLALHNHVGTYIETEEELGRLLDETDPAWLSLCYDVGHLAYAGGDVLRVATGYGERIRYIHLKDVDLAVLDRCRREGLGFHEALRHGIFTELGGGGVDFGRLLGTLDAIDYSGWIIVEQDTTKGTPLESARRNRAYLRTTFGV